MGWYLTLWPFMLSLSFVFGVWWGHDEAYREGREDQQRWDKWNCAMVSKPSSIRDPLPLDTPIPAVSMVSEAVPKGRRKSAKK